MPSSPAARPAASLTARRALRALAAAAVAAAAAAPAAAGAQTTFAAAGADAAAIAGQVAAFRAAIGGGDVAGPGALFGGVRREINWDGVPAAASSPNAFPPNGFNARGVNYATPGAGFQVSAAAADGPVRFGNVDPSYAATFAAFSPQKLFAAAGSTVTDVLLVGPGTSTPATTSAFGVVFTDVDLANTTSLEFFDLAGGSLGRYFAPHVVGSQTFSFLGVQFAASSVARVRVTSGNAALGAGVVDGPERDVVAMDDFIFAEAQVVPEPGTWALVAAGLAALGAAAGRRRRAAA